MKKEPGARIRLRERTQPPPLGARTRRGLTGPRGELRLEGRQGLGAGGVVT